MDALIRFLSPSDSKRPILSTDVTLSNWFEINKIAQSWTEDKDVHLNPEKWSTLLPSLDVWLNVESFEIHYVKHLIPTLDWSGGPIGVRLQLEPRNLEELYSDYLECFKLGQSVLNEAKKKESASSFSLWPKHMHHFLQRKFKEHFTVRTYIMSPETPDAVPEQGTGLAGNQLKNLFKIDIINAQRGFSDEGADESTRRRLSDQLRAYHQKHLNLNEAPDVEDVDALLAIDKAERQFDDRLQKDFEPALKELAAVNYPGFSNPEVILTTQVDAVEGLDHKAGVQFCVRAAANEGDAELLRLPEAHNGLGYQNLISMLFQLIRFRAEWQRQGKAGKKLSTKALLREPLHLVLIEEPEAHLHAQAQQVFIKQAYSCLRNGIPEELTTQLAVSTHSSHIAHEVDFTCLRYFRREKEAGDTDVPYASVVNLSDVFGEGDPTLQFAKRYLKATHSDLFFADAAILVEGAAERMLLPHFIKFKYPDLERSYISILEIGGSHAHRLKPLIERLGLATLIVTDIDSVDGTSKKKKQPDRDKGYESANDTLKSWIPQKALLDELLDLKAENKVSEDGKIYVAFQNMIMVQKIKVHPYTFEDALALTNIQTFKELKTTRGMLKKMVDAAGRSEGCQMAKEMFEALKGDKGQMALDVLFAVDPDNLEIPAYIAEGLDWLQTQLRLGKSGDQSKKTERA